MQLQPDAELRALVHPALQFDASAVLAHDALHNHEAQAACEINHKTLAASLADALLAVFADNFRVLPQCRPPLN